MSRFRPLLAAPLLLLLPACGSSPEGSGDALDAGSDVEIAEGDTGRDAPDVSEDTAPDAPPDAAPDTAPDVAPDLPPIETCDLEDDFSPNHDSETPHVVGPEGLDSPDLYVCPGWDDWFRIDLSAGRTLYAAIDFAHRIGDLDLYLIPTTGAPDPEAAVALSATTNDREELMYRSEGGGSYWLFVDGWEDAEGQYDLDIHVGCRSSDDCGEGQRCSFIDQQCVEDFVPACGDDEFEPNDDAAHAAPVAPAAGDVEELNRLRVCEEDDDYFSVRLDRAGSLLITAEVQGANDVDLFAFLPDGTPLGSAATEGQTENLALRFLAPGDYILAVDDVVTGLGLDVLYDLTIQRTDEACDSGADCIATADRGLCAEDGSCQPFAPENPSDAGGTCDSDDDCAGDLRCFRRPGGVGDNFCSFECGADTDCGAIEGGQCLPWGRMSAVCFPACTEDAKCPTGFRCVEESGACEEAPCDTAADCAEGESCRWNEFGYTSWCTTAVARECDEDDASEDNDTVDQAHALGDGEQTVRGLLICDTDDDWFRVTVPNAPTDLTAQVSRTGRAEDTPMNLFIFDAAGREVAYSGFPEPGGVQTTAVQLPAGDYLVRVNQVSDETNRVAEYSLTLSMETATHCAFDAEECLAGDPPRLSCNDETGACEFFEGGGLVPLGGACDSGDDCGERAEFCIPLGTGRAPICSRECTSDRDCETAVELVCAAVGGGFQVCVPPM